MWLACRTEEEIADAVGQAERSVNEQISELSALSSDLKKAPKVAFLDEGFEPPIYNIWTFAKKTNAVGHPDAPCGVLSVLQVSLPIQHTKRHA